MPTLTDKRTQPPRNSPYSSASPNAQQLSLFDKKRGRKPKTVKPNWDRVQLSLFAKPLSITENLVASFLVAVITREKELFLEAMRQMGAYFPDTQYEILLYQIGHLLSPDEQDWIKKQVS